jgi:hypothetical protein
VFLFGNSPHFSHGFTYFSPGGFPLVGGFNPSEKYEFVSWDDYSFPIYGKS